MLLLKNILKTSLLLSFSLTGLAHVSAEDHRLVQDLGAAASGLNQVELSCEVDEDCTSYPMGAKACGGPSAHMVSSEKNPHKEMIKALLKLQSEKEREINRDSGLVSNCSFVSPPQVSCQKNKCVAVEKEEVRLPR